MKSMKRPILTTIFILLIAIVSILIWQYFVKTQNASATEKKFVIFQGMRMIEGWPEQIKKGPIKN